MTDSATVPISDADVAKFRAIVDRLNLVRHGSKVEVRASMGDGSEVLDLMTGLPRVFDLVEAQRVVVVTVIEQYEARIAELTAQIETLTAPAPRETGERHPALRESDPFDGEG